ncbi:hypothetical protein OsI_24600 [Oryza sativa Indica Group]|uniref:Uncharacterized protein n=3 Tax=Oryza sativa TaxID=4530 RepID=B9FV50_ORYSJ|nr:hypothetical protein OsI_24600 [Oryza sativa Indica Group]EEE66437.1 hypothetical protein OsJ_22806 [Oryza sativa Japonica Group]BAC10385.1 hypothetical protein [Oryza sativa Japonica Group]BAD31949.1 hypothetical protein [Oryza sativa Japonica Group]
MHGFRVVSDDGEGDDDASRVEVEQAGDEVDIILDCLKETGTKSMDMATLDQTTYLYV